MNWFELMKTVGVSLSFLLGAFGVLKMCLAAGRFFDRAAAGVGSASERVALALEGQRQSQELIVQSGQRSAESQERMAKSAEVTAQMLPTLQKLQDQREEQGMILRVISRQLREMRAAMGVEDLPDGGTDVQK